jgi:anionic cell wall polymer biosynthesis LytR-Cps2A-Psr (LCP) family protein
VAGPALAVATVEHLTGIRIDHLAIVDQRGLASLVDVLGGVDVSVPEAVADPASRRRRWPGEQHLDGDAALLFVRQRYGLPGGDFDRIGRQHQVVGSLLASVRESARGLDVRRLYRLLDTLTAHVTVDEEWETKDMVRLMLDLRHLDEDGVRFMTAPVLGTGWEGRQSVVRLDPAATRALWEDLRADRVPADH